MFLGRVRDDRSGDDYYDIAGWGEAHLSLLRHHHGIPCADWLRKVMNRIDPDLFAACFSSWVAECWPDNPELVAVNGKTSCRGHDQRPAKLKSSPPRKRWPVYLTLSLRKRAFF